MYTKNDKNIFIVKNNEIKQKTRKKSFVHH